MSSRSRYPCSVATVLLFFSAMPAAACPFCSPVSQTFTEEIASMDVVVIARLTVPPAGKLGAAAGQDVPKATFEITEVLKGQDHLRNTKSVQTVFFSAGQVGDLFLIVGVDPPAIAWSTPLKVSERAVAYLRKLEGLPAKGAERLRFFQNYLEDEDDMLSRDAYDEFARTPYDMIKELKPHLDHDQIVAWIKNSEIPVNRRRLYLVLLSVCGDERDAGMLERMIRSEDRQSRAGLDAMIGCYLTLTGPKGMPLIEDLFLKNQQAEYADTYSAIMALRFHGTETDVIPQERILEGLRYMLDRPQLADLVIPDLARWQDWSQIDRLVQLFKDADEKSSWVRVPVVNYLRACPKPEAKERIKELEKIDPDAIKRASVFLPFGPGL
ncbi:MAG: hypothetical protein KJ000_19950 [Pirellulaceae bacterium]|nr:hypothetical protein [Pirellulaceae bacterium]